ncbi:hypothetical protein MFMK1_003016 [Metallumcola ferriviriculae]|uniref:Uncharacterized protein n=1 Tax=Metallumcola ferriviriculae TaxID=3039180 RepID=A0AAU0USE8_9FIRM|nr:hypothetical protein MFMK1_003016 [Desulfitibacteraceae bacterium MK1]
MKRWVTLIVLSLIMLAVSGCSVGVRPTDGGKDVATPLQVQTFSFEAGLIEKEYIAADKKCQEALGRLLDGDINKFAANAVFITTGKLIRQSITEIKAINAPGQLEDIRDDLNFSLVYYQEALETVEEYLNTEDGAVLEKTRQEFAKAAEFLRDYQDKLENLDVPDDGRNGWY